MAGHRWVLSDLLVYQGRVASIGQLVEIPADVTEVDAEDLWVVPGFIDIQINGAFGCDFTNEPETMWNVGRRLPEHGVTAFLPTVITSPESSVAAAQCVLSEGPPPGYEGATPLGLHLEGPLLSPERVGTHDAAYLREPNEVATETWSRDSWVRIVTLAPELAGALDLVGELVERGVTVALGHSNATYEEAIAGIRCGASVGTHLYNAMSGFHHRSPGLVGALLCEPEVTVGIITDGIHSHPAAVNVAWQAKGPDQVVLVTDAMAAMGMGHGHSAISSVDVVVDQSGPRTAEGTLAGSTLAMDEAVRNLRTFTDCSSRDAVRAATANPARVIREPDRGILQVGARADIALLDGGLEVVATFVGGEAAYDRFGLVRSETAASWRGDL